MKLKLAEKQLMVSKYAMKHPYSIWACGPRTGKSVITLDLHEKLGGRSLIVAPAYLLPNWKAEIRKCLGDDVIVDVFSKGSQIYPLFDTDICVTSYALAMKAPHLFEWCDQLFIDEVHNLKSMETQRTKFFHQHIYENSIPRVHLLSGTLLKNRVKEFYSPLAICNYNPAIKDSEFLKRFEDEITFADYFSHRVEYTMERSGRWFPVVKWEGDKNIEELERWKEGVFIKVSTEEVVGALPGYEDFLISDSPDEALLEAFHAYYSDDDNHRMSPTLKAEAALKKVPFTVQYVEDLLEKSECVPIYTDHVESAKALAAHFGVPALTGQTPAKTRAEVARRFQSGEGRVLVATIRSMSEGVTLSRANDLVLNDPPWVPGDLLQLMLRIQSIGKGVPGTIHRILGSPQDAQIYDEVGAKRKTIERVL